MVNNKLMYAGIGLIMIIGGLSFFLIPDTQSPTTGALYSSYNLCSTEKKDLNNGDIFCRCKFAKIHDLNECKDFTQGIWKREDYDLCMKEKFEWLDQGNFPKCWELLKKQ